MKPTEMLEILSLLFFIMSTFHAKARINLEESVDLITEVFKQNSESSVTILHSSHYDDLREADLLLKMSKLLCKRKIVSITADFNDWKELKRYYFVENRKDSYHRRPLIVIFLSKEKSFQSFQNMSKELRHENELFYLVLFTKSDQEPSIDFCMNPVGNPFQLRLDALMVVRCYEDNILRAWYTLDGDKMSVSIWGIWHPQTKSLELFRTSRRRKIDLGGKQLTIGTVNSSALTVWKENGQLSGYYGDLFKSLSQSMNFTWKLGKKERNYGSWNATGKYWTGAMGLVIDKKVDLLVTDMAMISIRTTEVDFTIPLLRVKYILYVQKPQAGLTIKWAGHFEIFDILVWAAILLLVLITPLLLTLMKMKIRRSYVIPLLFLENYLNVWSIYCQQGLLEFPRTSSLRLVYFSIFVSALIIFNYYSAFLISRLTYPTTNDFLPDMEAFIKDGTYKLIVLKNSADYNLFEFAHTPTLKTMFKLMWRRNDLPESSQAGFDMVCQQRVGFFVAETARRIQGLDLKCKLHKITTDLHEISAMALPKGSQYKTEMNRKLYRLKISGIFSQLYGEYIHPVKTEERSKNEVTIWEIVVILLIVTTGMLLGALILLVEKMFYRRESLEVKQRKVRDFITPENSRKWYNFENQDRYDENGELNVKFLKDDYRHKVVFSPGARQIKLRLYNELKQSILGGHCNLLKRSPESSKKAK